VFPERWIGRVGSTAWPVRSPELNHIDFHIRKRPKSTAYVTKVSDLQKFSTTNRELILGDS
jgi:hypothetical protein